MEDKKDSDVYPIIRRLSLMPPLCQRGLSSQRFYMGDKRYADVEDMLVYALYFAASTIAAISFGDAVARAVALALLALGTLFLLMRAAGLAPRTLDVAVYELALVAPLVYALALPHVAPPDVYKPALAALAATYGLFLLCASVLLPIRDKATS